MQGKPHFYNKPVKINKRNPIHWLLLVAFLVQGVLGLLLRATRPVKQGRKTVVLYGHKLNGNLLALQRHIHAHPEYGLQPIFLSMDAAYRKELEEQGISTCSAASWDCAVLLGHACAVISDHGLHALQPLLAGYQWLGLRFFDVWHGIPFKGFDGQDFRLQRRYDETWVASTLCRDLYISRFDFELARVQATGYPRTDRLVQPNEDLQALRAALGLPAQGRLILFAPTWAQDAKGRSIYPFGYSEAEFLQELSTLADRHGATVLLRSHLNSGNVDGGDALPPGIVALPSARYPDAESILLISDVLVCDWSSIAFDYLLLKRPTIFLDVPPPFRKGFSLGSEYRFGPVVADLPPLLQQLDTCLTSPDTYWHAYGEQHHTIRQKVYGRMADGLASQRCIVRLLACIR